MPQADCEQEDWQTEYKAREDRNSSNIYVVGVPIEWSKDVSRLLVSCQRAH
jgi:hypothetical protein